MIRVNRAFAMAVLVTLAGCGKSDTTRQEDKETSDPARLLIGRWKVKDGQPNEVLRFVADGRLIGDNGGGHVELLTYEVSNRTTLVVVSQTSTSIGSLKFISDDELILGSEAETGGKVLVRQK